MVDIVYRWTCGGHQDAAAENESVREKVKVLNVDSRPKAFLCFSKRKEKKRKFQIKWKEKKIENILIKHLDIYMCVDIKRVWRDWKEIKKEKKKRWRAAARATTNEPISLHTVEAFT